MRSTTPHIAVATDFSESSVGALSQAIALARRDGGRVTAVHVVGGYVPEVGWPAIWGVPPDDARARLSDVLGAELAQILSSIETGDVEVTPHLAFGDPAIQLTRWAGEADVDLLVIAPTGKSGIERLVLGSTARTVLSRSPVPVWVARNRFDVGHVVIAGVDLKPGGERVVAAAQRYAERAGLPLQIVHAYDDPGEERIFAVSSWEDQHRYRELVVGDHRERLDVWAAQHLPGPVSGQPVALKMMGGAPWRALQEAAQEQGAALLVVGRHEHGAMHQLFIGSTTDALVRRAACPVLVVP
jgi:nucleotide-binding universal stress UspA family protein